MNNLYSHVSSIAQKYPDSPALISYDDSGAVIEEISYLLLKKKLESAAGWLLSNNLSEGDSVAFALRNSSELLILSWAAWSMGIVTVPLDMKKDTLDEHVYKIKLSKAKVLIRKKDEFKDIKKKLDLEKVKIININNINENLRIDDKYWKKGLDHLALILFTSGTTAHPKGVMLSLENLIVNAQGIKDWLSIQNPDRFIVNLPLHHINSTTFCLASLSAGASIAIFSNYSNSKFWQRIAISQATFTSIVPSICFDQLAKEKEFNTFKDKIKLNRIQIGSAPVVVGDVKEFIAKYKIPLYQGYGQTETALRVTGVPMDLDNFLYKRLVEENSIGKPMTWAEVEVIDEKGDVLTEGKEGEISVKGKAVMKGYIGKKEGFKNGYFTTGDIGYFKTINSSRYFFLKGRKKEIIIKGGINISPVSVESKLKELSKDIDQVYVVGVEDKRYGEEIGAVICWKADVDIQKATVGLKYKLIRGSEHISSYEAPYYLFSFNSSDLPMTSTGKVQRSILKNRINKEDFEKVNLIYKNSDYKFLFLSLNSKYLSLSFDLYNYCWDPLVLNINKFKKQVKNNLAIVAVDSSDKVQGLIILKTTNISEKKLSSMSYDEVLLSDESFNKEMQNIICIAICSSNYKPSDIPKVNLKPTVGEVKEYLLSGKDSVYNFHAKPKGGFKKGASLISLLPNARKEDKRSLGYNMLLKYPKITKEVCLTKDASVAVNLIESVMLVAREFGIKNVYAFSRPSGLASYFSRFR